jgi:peptidoglycan hydrolase-like protein with peptidoglycan-binding domain
MKKLIIGIAVAAFCLAGYAQAQTATTSTQVNSYLAELKILRQLRQGMTGEDIKTLQAILATQPDVYPEGIVSGYYGPLTTKAVKKYQEKFGINSVGEVGPMTRMKLNEIIGFNVSTSTTGTSTNGCVRIPPGHFIAPGWIKNHGGVVPMVPACQMLPPGIAKKLGGHGTSTPPVDVTAPIISALSVSTTTASTSQIVWTTNELATTKLIVGTSSPVLSSGATTTPVIVGGLSTGHTVNLSNLATSTTYYFVALSADNAGNTATSSQMSFTTSSQ